MPSSPLRHGGIQDNCFNVMKTIQEMPILSSNQNKILITATTGDFATPPEKVNCVAKELKKKLPQNCEYFCQDLSQIPNGETLSPHMASSIRSPKVQSLFLRMFR